MEGIRYLSECEGVYGKDTVFADCKMTTHKECRDQAQLPCVPRIATPKTPSSGGNQNQRLADFCPADPPMIPGIIIHCVIALEQRHLDFEGLYRVPG